jgi:hypothetical protein
MSWQTLLEQATTSTIPNPLHSGRYLIPLSSMGEIQVAGNDATTFLQNMLTNDVSALTIGQTQLTGLCNPKGRLLSIFMLTQHSQSYSIHLPKELVAPLTQRLNMFKLRSQVTLNAIEDGYVIGLIGDFSIPSELNTVTVPKTAEKLRLVSCSPHQLEFIESVQKQADEVLTESVWQQVWIELGLPMVFLSTQETFTPQQVNLDLVDGVSFKKGCYPGQEVVARLHYLGSPSRRLFQGVLASSHLPEAGTSVLDDQGETLGHIVQASPLNAEQAVCQLSLKLAANYHLAEVNGSPLTEIKPYIEEAID